VETRAVNAQPVKPQRACLKNHRMSQEI